MKLYTLANLLLSLLMTVETFSQVTECHTEILDENLYTKTTPSLKSSSLDTVYIHLFAAYDVYLHFEQSEEAVRNYIEELFTQVEEIYALDNLPIALVDITIWKDADPYNYNNINDLLLSFSELHTAQHSGHLAHLVTFNGGVNGGKSFLRGLCDDRKKFGVSRINGLLESPGTYSWDVYVLAHELGHNLGSQHTHDCVWGPNQDTAIDGCGLNMYCTDAGIPSNGGTIMSYCHDFPGGIDFTRGIGPEPRQRMKSYIQSCLDALGTDCHTAQEILTSGTVTIDNLAKGSGATNSGATNARWYSFTPDKDGIVSIHSCHQGVDTRLHIYKGTCEQFSLIASADDNCPSGGGYNYASSIEGIDLLKDENIYIEWDDRWSPEGFSWTINFTSALQDCSSNQELPTMIDSDIGYASNEPITYGGHIAQSASLHLSSKDIVLQPGMIVQRAGSLSMSTDNCKD